MTQFDYLILYNMSTMELVYFPRDFGMESSISGNFSSVWRESVMLFQCFRTINKRGAMESIDKTIRTSSVGLTCQWILNVSGISKGFDYLMNLIRDSLEKSQWKTYIWIALMFGDIKWKKSNIPNGIGV